MEVKYDIGLVCLMNYSIGNNLVNYALYRVLKDKGYSVLVIGSTRDMEWHCRNRNCLWNELPYDEGDLASEDLYSEELYELNDKCRFFITGSDQTLRYLHASHYDYYTYLPWVRDSKYKATYAASFGVDQYEGDSDAIEEVRDYLRRFDKITVREKSGVKLLAEEFGIFATQVIDPVFLCNKKYYLQMAASSGETRLPQTRFVFGYLLDDIPEKELAVKKAAEYFSSGENRVIMERLWCNPNGYTGELNALPVHKNEEWLACVLNSDFVVTDSFHCIAFCVIFKKEFAVIYDPENYRGFSRIRDFLTEYDLMSRFLAPQENFSPEYFANNPIDYDKVYKKLDHNRSESENILMAMLQEASAHDDSPTESDRVHREKYEIIREQSKAKRKEIAQKSEEWLKSVGWDETKEVVLFGAGSGFHDNISLICEMYPVKYVCDNNSTLWGKEISDGIKCISPEQIADMRCVVVITVGNPQVLISIKNQLDKLGIVEYSHVMDWIDAIKQ